MGNNLGVGVSTPVGLFRRVCTMNLSDAHYRKGGRFGIVGGLDGG